MTVKADDEDIEASRAPLLDHLNELRNRLTIAVAALCVAFIACFAFAQPIFMFLVEPFTTAVAIVHPEQATAGIDLYNTGAFGFFTVKMQIALFAAIVITFPILAWQAYAFIAPGLYRRERAAVAPFLVAAPVMFTLGAAFVFYIAMPFALRFALGQEVTDGSIRVRYLPKVDEYLGLVTTLVIAFGLCFQMPVVLSLLARVRMVTASALRSGRRYALVGIAAFAALVTPPDPFSMLVMTIPLYGLYELSIWIVWLIERGLSKDDAAAAG